MTPTSFGLTPQQLNYAEPSQWLQTIRQALADTRCAAPGFLVEDINPTTQTVTVQVAVQERVRTPNGAQWWDIPQIGNVPIVVPRGGGFSMTLPLKKGDKGLLIFCDTCFDSWWQNGTDNAPPAQNLKQLGVTQASGSQRQFEVRRHYIHDCGFIPGMWTQKDLLTDYSTDSMQLRTDDHSAFIDIAENVVTISGTDEVDVEAPLVTVSDGVGSPLFLMTTAWQSWFTINVLPHITTGVIPAQPGPTTVLKGQ